MKSMFPIASLVIMFLIIPVIGMCDMGEYDHKIEVENIRLEWKLDKEMIHIRLAAKTDAWVGIGFNPTTEMKDANFIIGFVKDGEATVTDHFGITNRQHEKDTKADGKENITDISGKEENGITEISFTIPLDSGDSKDRIISPDTDTTVLLAYGTGRDSYRTKHAFKTALKVHLTSGKFEQIK